MIEKAFKIFVLFCVLMTIAMGSLVVVLGLPLMVLRVMGIV